MSASEPFPRLKQDFAMGRSASPALLRDAGGLEMQGCVVCRASVDLRSIARSGSTSSRGARHCCLPILNRKIWDDGFRERRLGDETAGQAQARCGAAA